MEDKIEIAIGEEIHMVYRCNIGCPHEPGEAQQGLMLDGWQKYFDGKEEGRRLQKWKRFPRGEK